MPHARAEGGRADGDRAEEHAGREHDVWIVTIEEGAGGHGEGASGDAAEAEVGAERGGIASDASREFRDNGASEADEEPVARPERVQVKVVFENMRAMATPRASSAAARPSWRCRAPGCRREVFSLGIINTWESRVVERESLPYLHGPKISSRRLGEWCHSSLAPPDLGRDRSAWYARGETDARRTGALDEGDRPPSLVSSTQVAKDLIIPGLEALFADMYSVVGSSNPTRGWIGGVRCMCVRLPPLVVSSRRRVDGPSPRQPAGDFSRGARRAWRDSCRRRVAAARGRRDRLGG